MPVQAIVTAAQIAARKPHSPIRPPVSPKNTQPMPKIAAGTKVNTDMTPSRNSQEERHCEKARQARSGRPRWNTEETRSRGGEDEGGRERDKTEPAALRQQAERRGEAEQKQQRKPGARSGREKDNRQRRMHRFA